MKTLVIAFGFNLAYHVIRCAAQAGAEVHVLGNGPAKGVALSRFCRRFHTSYYDVAAPDANTIIAEIIALCETTKFDRILPSDDVSTHLLIAIAGFLPAPTIPLTSLETFDLLNDKSRFTAYCAEIGLRVPQTKLFRNRAELPGAFQSGAVQLPATIKPVSHSGGAGVRHLLTEADLGVLDAIDYAPVLAQRHIIGRDVGISIVASQGTIDGFIIHSWNDHEFVVQHNEELRAAIERLVKALNFTGPADFDAMIEEGTGHIYLIECNPRFWYSIVLAMVCGLNFVDLALRPHPTNQRVASVTPGSLRRRLFRNVATFWTNGAWEWRLLAYQLADPILYFVERYNWFDDAHIAVSRDIDLPLRAAERCVSTRALVSETG